MQFHLNGFRSGDPHVTPKETAGTAYRPGEPLPDSVDVLIVGCGPAGLTLAAQLSVFGDISTCIVEQKPGPLALGQADGIACRTMEAFEAFGFADKVAKEAYWVNETSFWKPDPARPGTIMRSSRVQDVEDGLSEFPHVILNQARVHDFYLEFMRNQPAHIEPAYSRRLLDLDIATDPDASHPVTVRLERCDPGHEGEIETIRAHYVVGCDGARSAVRKSLGRELRGDSANQAWGVMDVLAVTDFPDIRLKAAIQSANEGNLLIIPREGGYLVRMYVEMDKLSENERVASRNITAEHLVAAARRILHPHTLEIKEIVWWSVYEIGQRLTDKFDDVPEDQLDSRLPRVFIAGDACHTHSPKAGQGMNVSIQDAFNLGWKLASVLRGTAAPHLLHSYSSERQTIAQELIDFDRKWAAMFSAPPKGSPEDKGDGVDPAEFQRYFVQQGRFTAGTATHYTPSLLTGEATHQHLAEGLVVGMRFHSAPVIRLADAKPLHLGHVNKADGRWRIFAFSGEEHPHGKDTPIRALCDWLETGANSPIRAYTPAGADIDSVIDLRAVFQQPVREIEVGEMPALLVPQKGKYGLRDYEKMFCPDFGAGRHIYDLRGIDRQRGCLVIVRPDQYVANVLPLGDFEGLAAFFERFMQRPG